MDSNPLDVFDGDDRRALEVLGRLPDPRPELPKFDRSMFYHEDHDPGLWCLCPDCVRRRDYPHSRALDPGPNESIRPADNRGMIRGAILGLLFTIAALLAAIVVVKAVIP